MILAKGIDISRYNISFDPNKAVEKLDFVFQKATEGATYVDLLYEQLWQGVSQIDIRGAYHYQKSETSWKAQADHLLNTIVMHDYHILALDLESYGNIYSDTFFADTKRIIDYWRLNAPSKKVILYTNGDGYKQLYYSLLRTYGSNIIKWMDELPLWFASPATAGLPFLPTTRKTWKIHQYSWSGLPSDWGTGGTRVDLNVFNGDALSMRNWVGLETTTPPEEPPTGETMDKYMIVTDKVTSSLNIRTSGENLGTANDLGPFNLLRGDIIHVVETNTNLFCRFDALYRNNAEITLPISPSNQYWALEKDSLNAWLVDTVFTPPKKINLSVTLDANYNPLIVNINGTNWIKP